METENLFISCGANTVENGILWLNTISTKDESTYLAYSSHNMIVIVNFTLKKVECTLIGHTGRVTTITSSKNQAENYIEIVSSGEDGSVILWRHHLGDPIQNWTIIEKLSTLQDGSITSHSSLSTDLGILISASNSHARMVTWFRSTQSNAFSIIEEIQNPPAQMSKTLTLMNCPTCGSQRTPSVILCVGSVDSRVHLRLFNISGQVDGTYTFSKSTPAGLLTGHEDWVTCLSESFYLQHPSSENSTVLFFASGSQDSKIRIWKITPSTLVAENESTLSLSGVQSQIKYEDSNELEDVDDTEEVEGEDGENEITNSAIGGVVSEENTGEARCAFIAPQITKNSVSDSSISTEPLLYSVTLETLLVGHEDWVTSLHWMSPIGMPISRSSSSNELSLRLFSTSMDRNMVIWSPDPVDGIWSPNIRIGDIGGNLGGSVGGNLLGFVSGCTMVTKEDDEKENESILGIGFGGSFHLWQRNLTQDSTSDVWKPIPFLTGHFGAVTDVIWSNCPGDPSSLSNNEFILTVSVDQTCRLFAPVVNKLSSAQQHSSQALWSELSRPQIHGYNLSSIQLLPHSHFPFTFFSAGDEKAIRSFEAPTVVLEGLSTLADNTIARELLQINDAEKRVQSAYIPELGLTNRSSNLMTGDEIKEQASRGIDSIQWGKPPLEGQLADKTIWPEVNKLHGHTGDVVCLSASNCGTWLASAAKGRDTKSSAILIWELKRMVCIASLLGHESTVTALAFSPNSRYLASGGKDRSLLIHECTHLDDSSASRHQHSFTPRAFLKSAHKRIIWDLAWIGESGEYFSTASRDGTVKIWKVDSSSSELSLLSTISPFDGIAVTSIDSTLHLSTINTDQIGWYLVMGAENGHIQIWFVPSNPSLVPFHIHSVSLQYIHGATVSKIKWKESTNGGGNSLTPTSESASEKVLKFVSCGEDFSVRVFQCHRK